MPRAQLLWNAGFSAALGLASAYESGLLRKVSFKHSCRSSTQAPLCLVAEGLSRVGDRLYNLSQAAVGHCLSLVERLDCSSVHSLRLLLTGRKRVTRGRRESYLCLPEPRAPQRTVHKRSSPESLLSTPAISWEGCGEGPPGEGYRTCTGPGPTVWP